MDFYYENDQLTGFSSPYYGTPQHNIFYNTDEKIKYIVSYVWDSYRTRMASAIFSYDLNGNVIKVNYKAAFDISVTDPYFGDLANGNIDPEYDSLVYDVNKRIESIYTLENGSIENHVKFYYEANKDVPFKLEEYVSERGALVLYDQIVITTNDMDAPYRHLWFLPYARKMERVVLPILFDDPSTYIGIYLSYVNKCITNYKVYNDWGFYNYQNTIFTYHYNSDHTILTAKKQGNPFDSINYKFR